MKRTFIFIGILLLLVSPVMSQQIFVEIDEDFPYWIDKTTTTSTGLVAFSPKSTIGYRQASFRVSTWNGLFWTNLPTLEASNVFYGSQNNLVVDTFNDDIVIAGSFYAQGSLIKGITRWNGSNWEPLGGGVNSSRVIHDEISISDIASFDNELFVCGDFNLADGLPVKNFAKYSNGNWIDIPTGLGTINHMELVDSALYIAGNFMSVDGISTNNLARWIDGKWEAVSHTFTSDIIGLANYDSKLVVITENGFYLSSNSSWIQLGKELKVHEVEDVVSFEGRLYASGLFVQNGRDSLRLIALTETDMSVYLRDDEIISTVSNKIMLNAFAETLYVSGTFTNLKGKDYNRIATFKPGRSVLEGQVYLDKNANCVYDSEDKPKANAIVSLNNGESYTSTDVDGRYTLFISNQKTSTIEIFPANNETPLCNGAERTVVTSGSDSLLVEDFALKLNEMTPVRLTYSGETGYIVKHGYTGHYILDCASVDASKFPMEVTLNFDKRLSEFKSSMPTQNSGSGFVKWVLSKNTTIEIEFLVSPYTIEMGDQLAFTASAQSINTTGAQQYGLNQTVVSAFDPNDKQCDKSEISTTEQSLEYFVRFQNLGTDNARDVHIVDTIDQGIPIEYIQIHKNSHYERHATSYKVRGHAIVWSFEDIELPPKSEVGDEGSSGYIAYRCGMSERLQIGDVFRNTAYIYFDFQPAVVTNTTRSVVVEDGNPVKAPTEEFSAYPNPSANDVNIVSQHTAFNKLTVYATDGKMVYSNSSLGSSLTSTISLGHLPNGIYFVQIDHALGTKVIPIVLRTTR